MKKIFLCICLFGSAAYPAAAQQQKTAFPGNIAAAYTIAGKGIVSQKIALKHNTTPQVKITNIKTEPVTQLPAGIRRAGSFEPDVFVSVERKQPFAFINIPEYRISGSTIEHLVSYDLEITEQEIAGGTTGAKPTTVQNSVLSSGTWYKIGVPSRGVYKIDYNFLQSIGVNPAGINPATIRLYGNGGTVLPEQAGSDQPDDLIENAIFVSSSGSTFGQGDYILFYANGPLLWQKDSLRQTFTHVSNYYENQSYYFLNFDLGPGKRIATETATGPGSYTVNTFDDYALLETDSFNLGSIGKVWWGNRMNSINSASLTQNLSVALGAVNGPVTIKSSVGNISDASGNVLRMRFNGQPACTYVLGQAPTTSLNVFPKDTTFNVPQPSTTGAIPIQFIYDYAGTGAAYIDYLQFNYRRQMSFPGGQMGFRDWQTASLPDGQNASYVLQNAPAGITVWEITDPLTPVKLQGTAGSGTYTITRPGHSLREFVSFDGSQLNTPNVIAGNPVPNQNLHGMNQVDLLIVTPPEFRAAAEDLAAFHRQRDNMTVGVAQTNQIYNEFSSGGQDIGGIRNFIKMFYDRSTGSSDMIKNVLFMGAASYDYKNRLSFNTNFVPTYETYESAFSTAAYSSDDYFALLDDGEDINSNSAPMLDVGTGRIPAFTAQEAQDAVNKVKNYCSPASFGPWKNVVTYVADDKDNPASEAGSTMNHLNDCEAVNSFFTDSARVFNLYKQYCDAYREVSTPSGGRYPMVNKAINDQIYNGTFFTSYSGHGSPDRWAHEAILTPDDYGSWKNKNKLPVMVTATCDFGRFDDPGHRSAGAKLAINPNGGSIAMITTTQVVYQTQNTELNRKYTRMQFTRNASGQWRTLGEALAAGKNAFSGTENNHKYVVLGDPALKMAMPVHIVASEKLRMLDGNDTLETDTIKALGRYLLSGSIKDQGNNLVADFNGPVYVTVFDKARSVPTVNPDQGVTPSFVLQTNIVAKVKGTVRDGKFTVIFIAPKDINYDYGEGKISYYANTDVVDASGLDTQVTVGGYNDDAPEDNEPPVVKPYIDNEKFRDGGVTGPNPLLYVKLYDDNGINVSGSSIGHDLVAILDEDLQNPYVMNSYYETEQDDYRKGFVNFPMYNLPEGKHTIRVKAWDVYNNSGEGTVTFEVKNKDKGFISDLYNYPNPFTDITHFVFQHNQEGENMRVTLRIFTAAGRLVKTIQQDITTSGNRTEIIWDGRGEGGAPLSKGVYFYQLNAKTDKGISATAYQKLVLLR